jgi:hypothetical protein
MVLHLMKTQRNLNLHKQRVIRMGLQDLDSCTWPYNQ